MLRRLAGTRTALFARANDFAVACSADAAAGSRLALDAPFAAEFLRAGWIVADGPGRFILAAEGRAFLVRSFGGEDRFAAQHREMETRVDDGRAALVNVGESPLARLNSRIRSATSSTTGCPLADARNDVPAEQDPAAASDIVVCDGDPRVFINPMFRLAITHPADAVPQRDMQFRLGTQGAFIPLVVNLAASTADIQPQSMRFVPATG